MSDLVIRPAFQNDRAVLWDFLAMAAYEPDATTAKVVPCVAKYLVGWQRPGDFGFIAEQNGEIIGAAWARRFSAEELRVPFGGEDTPKVSIGVKPEARGQGVGEKLMRALIARPLAAGFAFISACGPKIPRVALSASAFAISPVPPPRAALAACRSAWH